MTKATRKKAAAASKSKTRAAVAQSARAPTDDSEDEQVDETLQAVMLKAAAEWKKAQASGDRSTAGPSRKRGRLPAAEDGRASSPELVDDVEEVCRPSSSQRWPVEGALARDGPLL
jgi:hypothetical protein